jgi:hypothetical protein
MRTYRTLNLCGLALIFTFVLHLYADQTSTNKAPQAKPESATISCKALEVHASDQPPVMAVLFNQAESSDHDRLSDLLKQYSGKTVHFKAGSADWHAATVIRMKDCFGRGLLLIPAGTAELKEKEEFSVRFGEAAK